MISEIYIKNIAIIEETRVTFGKGLNILTGETGAGKSIIIDSINFVFGQRSSKDIIRHGAEEAFVSALIYVENENTLLAIKNMGIEVDDGGELLLTRSLNINGRNLCRINGKPASISLLKTIASLIIDIYGQHQNLSLLNKNKHRELLDRFCQDELGAALIESAELYSGYRSSMKLFKELSGNSKNKESALDILNYQINEIKEASIKPGEEEALKEKRDFLYNAERIKELSLGIINLLYRGDGSAAEKIGEALNLLSSLEGLEPSVKNSLNELNIINDRLSNVTDAVRDIADKAEGGGYELAETQKRLDIIKSVTSKYGGNEEETLKFLFEAEEKLENILSSEDKINALKDDIKLKKKEILKCCIRISEIRCRYAKKIEEEIEKTLHELGMESSGFKINIERRKTFDKYGMDDVEFFIKTNPGEDFKPLVKIASGGEVSRVMLSVKSVLSGADDIETFIFDEIDTGISGRTAQKVAEKLSDLGRFRQILCITHLSQICAAGDVNFCIEKKSDENSVRTTVSRLDEKQIINEIARLNGGSEITEAAIIAAAELRSSNKTLKEINR